MRLPVFGCACLALCWVPTPTASAEGAPPLPGRVESLTTHLAVIGDRLDVFFTIEEEFVLERRDRMISSRRLRLAPEQYATLDEALRAIESTGGLLIERSDVAQNVVHIVAQDMAERPMSQQLDRVEFRGTLTELLYSIVGRSLPGEAVLDALQDVEVRLD